MATPLASATILDGASRYDVSAPVGTSVAGLMAMLDIDANPSVLRITHPDGKDIAADAVLGHDLASGVVMTLSATNEGDRAAQEAAATRAASPWLRPVLTISVFLILITCIEIASLAGPVFGWWSVTPAVRIVSAVVCCVALSCSLTWWRLRTTASGLLATTALLGGCGTAFLPDNVVFPSQVAIATVVWTALTATLLVWLIDRSSLSATLAVVWLVVGCLVVYLIASDVPVLTAAPLALALATLAIATIPTFSFRIPETQLLDLPVVTTSAPTVRAPKVSSPSEITAARVRRSIREADARNQLLLIVCCGMVVAAAFPAARLINTASSEGLVALGLMVIAFLALTLVPRTQRDYPGRILPRVAAMAVAVAVLTSPQITAVFGASVTSLLVLIVAALLSVFAVVMARKRKSALLGRIADITQRLSLFLLLPAAVYSAGLFTLVRQLAS
ncbi:MAG: hypothetical protein Q4D79_07565 [Propionibacteriaceae bacterium]|nr:hypothetical protein [Propionibacteriaceae bacterium]